MDDRPIVNVNASLDAMAALFEQHRNELMYQVKMIDGLIEHVRQVREDTTETSEDLERLKAIARSCAPASTQFQPVATEGSKAADSGPVRGMSIPTRDALNSRSASTPDRT